MGSCDSGGHIARADIHMSMPTCNIEEPKRKYRSVIDYWEALAIYVIRSKPLPSASAVIGWLVGCFEV